MERLRLVSAAANYPYLQGLWAIPFGLGLFLAGVSNLERGPGEPVMFAMLGGGLLLGLAIVMLIARYYRDNYGEVTPTTSRQVRHGVAIAAWVAVLFAGANKYLFWSLDSPLCVYAAAFSAATLVYYTILVGVRPHHIVIWGGLLVVSLLPVWGGLGNDRDAIAMFPLGAAMIASGLLDQRLLARTFSSPTGLHVEPSDLGE